MRSDYRHILYYTHGWSTTGDHRARRGDAQKRHLSRSQALGAAGPAPRRLRVEFAGRLRSGSTSGLEDNRPDRDGERIRGQERGYVAESVAIGSTATARRGGYPRRTASHLKINSPPKNR